MMGVMVVVGRHSLPNCCYWYLNYRRRRIEPLRDGAVEAVEVVGLSVVACDEHCRTGKPVQARRHQQGTATDDHHPRLMLCSPALHSAHHVRFQTQPVARIHPQHDQTPELLLVQSIHSVVNSHLVVDVRKEAGEAGDRYVKVYVSAHVLERERLRQSVEC